MVNAGRPGGCFSLAEVELEWATAPSPWPEWATAPGLWPASG